MKAPGVERIEDLVPGGLAARLAPYRVRVGRKLGLFEAFDVEVPTPPRPDPVDLRGEFWAVTAYFNPSGADVHRENYDRFRDRLAAQGVPLLTVELGFGDRAFDLSGADADRLLQLRGGGVLWQKERLLNLGIRALPESCDRVAWLDCDVLFDRSDWAAETARLLRTYQAVQPFLRRVRLAKGQVEADPATLPVGLGENQVYYGVAFGVAAKGQRAVRSYRVGGSTGFAWAARRSLLARHGLYDRLILGGGDHAMARAMYGGAAAVNMADFPDPLARHLGAWADRYHADVRGSVAYADATVFHLWHGSPKARQYATRYGRMVEHGFDPEVDVVAPDGEALTWTGKNPGLEAAVAEYFAGRAEAATES